MKNYNLIISYIKILWKPLVTHYKDETGNTGIRPILMNIEYATEIKAISECFE